MRTGTVFATAQCTPPQFFPDNLHQQRAVGVGAGVMRVHHLNCGTNCPFGGRLIDGVSTGAKGTLVCHCLLLETDRDGLVLVDTGYGLRDVRSPHEHQHPRVSRFMRGLLNIQLREEETALRQVERLGFQASDVRHIILTHLDFDHAGGLDDFPEASIHLMDAEFRAASGPRRGPVSRNRYRPAQWHDVDQWHCYPTTGERWLGFEAVRDLTGLPPEILIVPLPGHTWGHAGVAVDLGSRWLLHAGDAYFYRGEVRGAQRECTPGLRAYQTLMEVHRESRLRNQQRLRSLSIARRSDVNVFCAHDRVEFERARAGRPL